jgi:cyclic lactone autoinducer peptide
MYRRILFIVVSIATFIAMTGIASACALNGYQPEVPKCLLK